MPWSALVGGQAGQAAKGAADAASTVAKSAADVARDTATSVTKLPTGVVRGRERCVLAPNGAPDCRAAAEAMCRAKGYVSGTSVDFETAEKCPPPYRVSSRNTPEGVCTWSISSPAHCASDVRPVTFGAAAAGRFTSTS